MTSVPRILLVLGVFLVILGAGLVYLPKKSAEPEVPAPVSNPGWETYTDDSLTFRYPGELGTTYIKTVEWPPKATVTGSYSCVSGRSEMGETEEVNIQGQAYCRTSLSEGAAGSIYTDYTYTVQKGDAVVSLMFTLRAPQCANYDEPQSTECVEERTNFNPDDLADRILQTVELN